MKLYLNSLNNETFECETELLEILENDLSKASGKKVGVAIKPLTSIDLLPEIFDESSSLDEVDDYAWKVCKSKGFEGSNQNDEEYYCNRNPFYKLLSFFDF